jgi:hypothetical protein
VEGELVEEGFEVVAGELGEVLVRGEAVERHGARKIREVASH